jgi:hypothetical protein
LEGRPEHHPKERLPEGFKQRITTQAMLRPAEWRLCCS